MRGDIEMQDFTVVIVFEARGFMTVYVKAESLTQACKRVQESGLPFREMVFVHEGELNNTAGPQQVVRL